MRGNIAYLSEGLNWAMSTVGHPQPASAERQHSQWTEPNWTQPSGATHCFCNRKSTRSPGSASPPITYRYSLLFLAFVLTPRCVRHYKHVQGYLTRATVTETTSNDKAVTIAECFGCWNTRTRNTTWK